MSNYIKRTFYKDEDCRIVLEEQDGHLFVHVTIFQFSKAILKRLLFIWDEVRLRAYFQGYENIYTYTKDTRMLKFFKGGKKYGDVEVNGETYEVIGWDLK